MIELLTDPNAWAALLTLTVLEIVLGIDNVVFISVLVSRLDDEKAKRARQLGLALAFIFRIIMLFGLTWLMGLTQPVVTAFDFDLSWRDLILIGGGLFLIAKATHEIHAEVEAREEDANRRARRRASALLLVVAQLIVIDLVFSLDSIITAIGMARGHRDHDRRDRDRHAGHVCRLRAGRRVSSPTIRPPRCWRSPSWC